MGTRTNLTSPGPLRTLAWSTLINSAGNGAFGATAVVYLSSVHDIPGSLIGIGFTVAAIAGLLVSVPVGILADRYDPGRQAGVMAGLAGVASVGYAFVSGASSFLAIAIIYALLERSSVIARQTLIGVTFAGPARTTARALLRSVSNVGAALGTGCAALVLALGTVTAYRLLFVINALTYIVAGLLLTFVRSRPAPLRPAKTVSVVAAISSVTVLRDRPYAVVSIVNALLTVHIVIIEVILPLWVVNRTDAPHTVVALLVLANTVMVILFQVPVSRPFVSVRKAVGGLRLTALMLAAMFVFLHLSSTAEATAVVALLILTVGAQTGAEMVQGAASWPLSYDLAPPGQIGQYQGFFGGAEQMIQIVGPAGLTLLIIDWHGPGALLLAGTFAIVALLTPPLLRSLLQVRPANG